MVINWLIGFYTQTDTDYCGWVQKSDCCCFVFDIFTVIFPNKIIKTDQSPKWKITKNRFIIIRLKHVFNYFGKHQKGVYNLLVLLAQSIFLVYADRYEEFPKENKLLSRQMKKFVLTFQNWELYSIFPQISPFIFTYWKENVKLNLLSAFSKLQFKLPKNILGQ